MMLVQGTFDQVPQSSSSSAIRAASSRPTTAAISPYTGRKGRGRRRIRAARSDRRWPGEPRAACAGSAHRRSAQPQDLTSNAELMNLIRDMSGSTAWVVGHFDAVSRGMKLPNAVSSQVPPLRLVSARADVNGGVKATLRAETGDQAAAEQLREVVRGFIALARLQAGAKAGVRQRLEIDPAVGHGQNCPVDLSRRRRK